VNDTLSFNNSNICFFIKSKDITIPSIKVGPKIILDIIDKSMKKDGFKYTVYFDTIKRFSKKSFINEDGIKTCSYLGANLNFRVIQE
jgi:hypothetical protein